MCATEILEELINIRPDFRRYWDGENYYVDADGTFTACGVFSHFTQFFREFHLDLNATELKALGELVKRCEREEYLKEAAYTCFLENIAGDPPGETLAPFLTVDAIEFSSHWRPVNKRTIVPMKGSAFVSNSFWLLLVLFGIVIAFVFVWLS